jgi:hypothetical protein
MEVQNDIANVQGRSLAFSSDVGAAYDQRGKIIIGAMMNRSFTVGHVMMITPGEMAQTCLDRELDDYSGRFGKGFYDRGISKVPIIIECGEDIRSWNAPLCTNVDFIGATERLSWYRYKQ